MSYPVTAFLVLRLPSWSVYWKFFNCRSGSKFSGLIPFRSSKNRLSFCLIASSKESFSAPAPKKRPSISPGSFSLIWIP